MIEHLTVSLPRLPQQFEGLSVAALADLHAGLPWRRAGAVGRTVEAINSRGPDVILLLGDIVDRLPHASSYLGLMADLRAVECIYATLGNHEHEYKWVDRRMRRRPLLTVADWRRLYAEAGIELLVNEARPLERGTERIWLVGIDDCRSGHADPAGALAGVPPDECSIGFTHHPDIIDHPHARRLDLLLAGHTHGGQLRVPLLGVRHVSCRDPQRRAFGWVEHNGTRMYVTRGAGEGIPLRIGCPRQIPVFTLRQGEISPPGTS